MNNHLYVMKEYFVKYQYSFFLSLNKSFKKLLNTSQTFFPKFIDRRKLICFGNINSVNPKL